MKKWGIGIIIVIIFLAGCFGVFYYFQTTREVTINFTHITNATLRDSKGNTVATLTKSGQKQRLDEASTYSVAYSAENGYESGSKSFDVNTTVTVTVNPYLSTDQLSSLLGTESSAIHSAILASYPGVTSLYTITSEHLYQYGDWYGAKLVYKGNDIFNSDNLKIVAHKQGNTWQIVSNPPMPTLNTYNTTGSGEDSDNSNTNQTISTPADVLEAVDNL